MNSADTPQRSPVAALAATLMVALLFAFAVVFAACSSNRANPSPVNGTSDATGDGALKLLTTYSIVYDLVVEVAGHRATVNSLVPVGSDPHTYEPRPTDLQLVTEADAVFYHGLNLELWFDRFIESAGGRDKVIVVSDGIEPLLVQGGAYDGLPDPHAWLDVRLTMEYVKTIRDALIELDPGGRAVYKANSERYLSELEELDTWIRQQVEKIPPERRHLVTTENAFQYFARAYGFQVLGYIYNLAPEEDPSAQQITQLIDRIRAAGLPAIFVDTTINPRLIEQVAADSGARVAGALYVDSLGPTGSDGDSYIKMMRWNVTQIVDALGGE